MSINSGQICTIMQIKSLIFLLVGIFSLQAQRTNTNQEQAANTCTTIPNVGSPINMIANAKQYIEEALNIKNQYTVVKYIYFALIPPTTPATTTNGATIFPQPVVPPTPNQPANVATIYRMVFSIADYYGTKYAAVELSVSPFGIGAVKINRFLLTSQLSRVKNMIDPNIVDTQSVNCGDLKYVYSSFGNGNDNTLPYVYPGDNNNSAGLRLLNNLTSGNGNNANGANATLAKTCVTANFLETTNFFGTGVPATATDLISCIPNRAPVASILIGCSANVLSSLQLAYNNLNDNGTTLSAFAGNPATPANAITNISLSNATRLSITTFTTPNSIRIQTFGANNEVLTNYVCGTGTTAPQNAIIAVNDFLGFSGVSNGGALTNFDIVQYRAQ